MERTEKKQREKYLFGKISDAIKSFGIPKTKTRIINLARTSLGRDGSECAVEFEN